MGVERNRNLSVFYVGGLGQGTLVAAWIINVVVMIRTWNVQRESKGGVGRVFGDEDDRRSNRTLTMSELQDNMVLGALI
ncbi:hypothetical protein TrLO_g14582 [Triparma laevis f. longispina]|uniref:Uncharacterized protein n=1 Tax=Triparma laevis f. longispina TaxID=1714387 RepID=A0A9W7A6D0_9STRA|nr:hypothetical protein TrLO_g14582 [Triparma laevis f. longispina]